MAVAMVHYSTSSTSQTAHYQRHEMPTYNRSQQKQSVDNLYTKALQAWRMEAFENTFTYSDYESYLIVHLDERIRSFLKFSLGKHNHSANRHERAVSEVKANTLALGHRCWWCKQKLRAINEARRLQEELSMGS